MVDVTLLEVNLEGAEFTANAPFSEGDANGVPGSKLSKLMGRSAGGTSASEQSASGESSDDESSAEFEFDAESEETPSPAGPIVALIVLVLLAFAVKKLRGGTSDAEAEIDPDHED